MCNNKHLFIRRKEKLRLKIDELRNRFQHCEANFQELRMWKQKVEGILLNLVCQAGPDTLCLGDFEIVDGQIPVEKVWKTSRKFFTTEQAFFLLSGQKTTK